MTPTNTEEADFLVVLRRWCSNRQVLKTIHWLRAHQRDSLCAVAEREADIRGLVSLH